MSGGMGILNASANAAVMKDALLKRMAGSFAMARMITMAKAGGLFGLMRAGGFGIACTCCIKMAGIFSDDRG